MQSPAPFKDQVIIDALEHGWALTVESLEYAQVGYGSWHWHVEAGGSGRLFVTVDDVAPERPAADDNRPLLNELRWAYHVPLALTRAGLRLARPPIPTLQSDVITVVDGSWAISVWPYIDGRASQAGRYAAQRDAKDVLAIIRALHDVPVRVVRHTEPRRESFDVPGLQGLLQLVDWSWTQPHVGPHAAAAEDVLHRHADDIRKIALAHDGLVRRAPPFETWVITHGEPHAANVIFTAEGPVLIDWDTTKVAPRERDTWMIAADGYGLGTVDDDMFRLYRYQWDLSELADYARRFADPTDGGPEGNAAWADFMSYIERTAELAKRAS